MRLVALAPGKVNLCLYVGVPREDGLHPLASVVQPVSLADEIRLEPARSRSSFRIAEPSAGTSDEVVCAGVPGPNLASAAIAGFRARTGWDGPPVRLTIDKRVPVAAGMGGGSGDAAAALRLLAHVSGIPIPEGLAAELGADVPAQIAPGRTLVTGAGEHVEAVPEHAPLALVIVPSPHALSTPDVFREADRLGLAWEQEELAEIAEQLREYAHDLPPELMVNDLEPAAISLCPPIARALDDLRAAGAHVAMVSGSGPTTYGVFGDEAAAQVAADELRRHHPATTACTPFDEGSINPRPHN